MKFPEFPYLRPDYDKVLASMDSVTLEFTEAASAQEQVATMKKMDNILTQLFTQVEISAIRNTIDTRDKFYEAEREYNDNMSPLVSEKLQHYERAVSLSKFRDELEATFGTLLFKNIDISLLCFSPDLIPLIQEESVLTQKYQKLYASAKIDFQGKVYNLAQLGPFTQDPERTVRKAAISAYGRFFDEHQTEFDDIFDKLVKNRAEQAKTLGLKNYVEMGFLLRGRNCYNPSGVANFRRQVVEELVPITEKIKENQARRIGIKPEDFKAYDNTFYFPDGNADPQGTPDELMAAGKKMYSELSPETAKFIQMMFDMDLFDVLSKEGKAPGGYCDTLPAYHCPFIFANWNGTAGDVDVLTHEAGHAFASYIADLFIETPALRDPTMEGCESHSMSMEFLTEPWHELFFKEQTAKYELFHTESALTFIPYGCQVDHFQEIVYSNPELTPAQRNEEWTKLEKLYRPYMDNQDLPFYGRGAGWQRQIHIYQSPFYYIDYSLAQTVSLQFWVESMKDWKLAWRKYLDFVKLGGKKTFVDLVKSVGFISPMEDGCLKAIVSDVQAWLDKNQIG